MRALPVGEDALLVEVASGEDAQALHAELLRRRAEGSLAVREIVPAARTVLLDGLADPARLAAELTSATVPPAPPRTGAVIELPVRYDGPDLADVARLTGLTVDEVVARHTGAQYTVAFGGFMAGFAYLVGLEPALRVPRLDSPRERVPAGSVAIADEFSAVYPAATPGGWRLLGRCDVPLFDVSREPPALLQPGTRVRFTAS